MRRVVGGVPEGGSFQVTPAGEDTGYFQLTEDAGGGLTAGWVNRNVAPQRVTIRSSSDGVHWRAEQVIATDGGQATDGNRWPLRPVVKEHAR